MPELIDPSVNHFLHRRDSYRVFHSVCLTCFQPVAKNPIESKLAKGEEEHKCEGRPRHQYPGAIEQN